MKLVMWELFLRIELKLAYSSITVWHRLHHPDTHPNHHTYQMQSSHMHISITLEWHPGWLGIIRQNYTQPPSLQPFLESCGKTLTKSAQSKAIHFHGIDEMKMKQTKPGKPTPSTNGYNMIHGNGNFILQVISLGHQ